MASNRSRLPHEDRTAGEPRENQLHDVAIDRIDMINSEIRLFKLKIKDEANGVKFFPGQWLDVHIPSLPKAGGFTITSTPSAASPSSSGSPPYLELAIQRSPKNPPAHWMWREPASEILGADLKVRVGGSFTWPPFGWPRERVDGGIERVVFVAGGVGINPLIAMLSHIHSTAITSTASSGIPPSIPSISFLYSTKAPQSELSASSASLDPSQILFLPRLQQIATSSHQRSRMDLKVFVTNLPSEDGTSTPASSSSWFRNGRIAAADLIEALDGPSPSAMLEAEEEEDLAGTGTDRAKTVCYVCGPPAMTDEIVAFLGRQDGMSPERVFCEKWW